MTSELVTAGEAASYLGVDRSTLLRWSSPRLQPDHRRIEIAQKLPGRTGSTLYRRADVEALEAELRRAERSRNRASA